ncbi:hypothetical protein [Caldimonas brevitalea]|uniref:Right handed beta helix domain-containing protein n=1 Tax=Caldimonas brevitalea TaxID=413882 RepID=A0A0G3BRA0_9BURK|nr:hypothetical protein [Caldimonas brevitalea]AKJ29881.1 hypothetical protein AAW51_3190 [Caldimonas brevitalea]
MSIALRWEWVVAGWICLSAGLAGCGGGNSGDAAPEPGATAAPSPSQEVAQVPSTGASSPTTQTPAPGSSKPPAAAPTPPAASKPPPPPPTAPAALSLSACEPSGKGRDFQVGPGAGQLRTLADVPWESLAAGDTVRIFWAEVPYRGKIMINAQGRADAPVRVCGVPGPNGERPVVDGKDAVTRRGLKYAHPLFEQRSVVTIHRLQPQLWEAYPKHIQIDGLKIRGAHPYYSFTNSNGERQPYVEFGACVWVERGHNIVIANNEITDCTQAIFSRSSDEWMGQGKGEFSVTRNLRIAGNYMHGNGVVGDYLIHTTYVQSANVVYEFNRYGPMRAGALGNALKDRSVGPVIRYNRIEGGAHSIDLVETEDYAETAKLDPTYRSSWVYGNQIVKDGRTGTTIHYGGDHAGNEASYRKGTLYFFNNTVHVTGDDYAVLFQLSTTEETAEVWNNVFMFDPGIKYPRMREKQDNAPGIPSGGILNLGRNWIDARWSDAGPWHTVGGKLNGVANLITGTTPPVDLATMLPKAGSPVLDVGQSAPVAATGFPVGFQLDRVYLPKPRSVNGSGSDLGALER